MSPAGEIVGGLSARDLRIGIVVGRFNGFIGERLLQGALGALAGQGADPARTSVVRVPGAFEIPLALRLLAAGGGYDALIALGAVIRGDTPHFDYVAGECARGLSGVMHEFALPVAFGVLTVDTVEQAMERAGADSGNKGAEAALAAVEMANLARRLRGVPSP
jgi:6,7-dimethyl-8-ribityllumazine synthase